jgi:glycosyltransferase involved in cell wall biosynthesis
MAVVFIPTRGRSWLLDKTLPKWRQQDVDEIILVVEKQEAPDYHKHLGRDKNGQPKVRIIKLPESNRGINYSRHQIVLLANGMGCDRLIMSDDDIYPKPDNDVNRLFVWNGLNTLGIGIMVPFYGLLFGNETMKREDRPLMSTSALGKRLFSLNVQRVIAIGNFDVRLHSGWGDDELVRQGMAALQATWYIHAGVNGTSVAGRYTRGGINDFHGESEASRLEGQELSHRLIYKKWGPHYISAPGKRMLCHWRNFLDDFVPDWEKRIDWEKQ